MSEKRRIQDIVIPKTGKSKSFNDSLKSRETKAKPKSSGAAKSSSGKTSLPVSRPIKSSSTKQQPPKYSPAIKKTDTRAVATKRKTGSFSGGRRHSSAPQISIPHGGQSSPQHIMVGLALIMVLVVVIALFSLGARAKVMLAPQTANIPLDVSAVVYREPIGSQVGFDSLRFTLSESAPITVDSYEERLDKASGTVTIFNAHSTSSQRLVEETRFEAPDGKIFKLGKGAPVVVPGLTVSGGVNTPGSVTATVFADQPGSDYNLGLTDFTIPGFKGSSKYDNFYARSVTPIEGGFAGKVPILGDGAKAVVEADLKKRIAAQTLQRAKQEVPENFVFFPQATHLEFSLPVVQEGPDGGQIITQDATVTMALFDQDDLGQLLIEKALSGKVEGQPRVKDWSQISVELVNSSTDIVDSDSLSLKFNGQTNFEWWINYEEISMWLTGKRKKEVTQADWRNYHVEKAEISLRPFWQARFPENPDRISLELESY